ncbi:MAG: hypothetical protein ACYC1U_01505 [Candidatus Aquicultorales bacterium]
MDDNSELRVGVKHKDEVYTRESFADWLERFASHFSWAGFEIQYANENEETRKGLKQIKANKFDAWTVFVFFKDEFGNFEVRLEEYYENQDEAFERAQYLAEQVAVSALKFIRPAKRSDDK